MTLREIIHRHSEKNDNNVNMLSVNCSRIRHVFSSAQTLGLTSLHNVFSTSANTCRQRGRSSRNDPVTDSRVNKFQLSAEDAEHFEALEDFINQEGTQPHGLHLQRKTEALLHREMKQQQRRMKKKIMEKKHFRQPQEVNLLTWSAKQQIRYLNQQFPEEWTPENLADSFPVSVEGVRRLLESSYVPRSEQEMARHDRRVLDHWRELKEALALAQGPGGTQHHDLPELSAQFQHLLDSGKLPLMINAGGSSQLPSPPLHSEKLRQARVGLFESIVAGAPMVKAQEDQQERAKIQKENRSRNGLKLLKAISDFSTDRCHRKTDDHEEKGISTFFSDRSVKRR